jgi:hypothetical protein
MALTSSFQVGIHQAFHGNMLKHYTEWGGGRRRRRRRRKRRSIMMINSNNNKNDKCFT